MSFFSLFPPEVNSGLIYAGPGSGALTAAATAWNGLATDLSSASTSVSNVVSGLTGSWTGPSAAAMTSAAAPYATWLQTTSDQALQLGTQASAQASLYQTAYSAVIPPPAIAANRAQLLTLIATNFFGQNATAIAANEAQYAGYWATDAATMDSYLTATQTNLAAMQQPTPPPQVSQPAAQPAQAVQPQAQPATATDPSSSTTSSGSLTDPVGAPGTDTGTGATTGATTGTSASSLASFSTAANLASIPLRFLFYPISMLMSMLMRMGQMGGLGSLAGQTGAAGATTLMTQIGEFVDGKLQGAVGTLVGHFTSATDAISAKLGHAASLGSLKVPEGWAMAAQGMTRAAPVLPATTLSAPVSTMSAQGMPGGPFGNALMGALAGRGLGGVAAKAPKVIPRSPAGG